MRIPLEHFTATPVFALSPTTQCNEKSGSPSFSSSSSSSASDAAASGVFASSSSSSAASAVRVSSDSHGGQVGGLASYVAIARISPEIK